MNSRTWSRWSPSKNLSCSDQKRRSQTPISPSTASEATESVLDLNHFIIGVVVFKRIIGSSQKTVD